MAEQPIDPHLLALQESFEKEEQIRLDKILVTKKKIADMTKAHRDVEKEIVETLVKSIDAHDDVHDISKKITDVMKSKQLQLTKSIEASIRKILVNLGLQSDKIDAIISKLRKTRELFSEIEDAYGGITDIISAPINKLVDLLKKSKIGNLFVRAFGFDAILSDMRTNILQTLKESGVGFAGLAKAAGIAFSAIGNMLKVMFTNPAILALVAIAALIMLTWQRFQSLQKTLSAIRTEGGILADESDRLLATVEKTNLQLAQYGVTIEIAGKSVNALLGEFQTSQRVTEDLVKATSLMQSNLGMAADESAKYLSTMMAIGDLSEKNAANTAGVVANLAVAGKVAPKKVMADIAKSSEVINKWFRGTTQEVMKQAVGLARLGSSIEKAGAQAEKLLDWDTSITQEMEASVMLGRHLDLSMARFRAFQGDLEGATNIVLDQVGKVADFNKLNLIQKKAIADAAGLEVGALAQMLKQREEIGKMTDAEREAYRQAQAELGNLNQGMSLLQQTQKQIAQEKLSQAMEKMGAALGQIILPLMNLLLPMFNGLAVVINFLAGKGLWLTIAAGIGLVTYAVMTLWTAIGPVGWAIMGIVAALTAVGLISTAAKPTTPVPGMAEGGIATKPITANIAEGGKPEGVIPLDKGPGGPQMNVNTAALESKLDELISLIKEGSTINMDAAKVGQAIARVLPHPATTVPA